MTISSETRKAGPFTGNDVTTEFAFTFKVFAAADLTVVCADALGAETTLVLDTDYTAAVNANQNTDPGGSITLSAALATGTSLVITTRLANLQPTDITNNGGFFPQVITNALDRLTILIQQSVEQLSRSLKFSISTPNGVSPELPVPVPYSLIGWNAAGDGFQNTDPTYSTALSTDLASTASGKGASLVGFIQSGTGAVAGTVHGELSRVVHADNFGTLLQAINATPAHGILQLGAGPYVANFAITRSNITIRGVGMPIPNAGKTALEGGTVIQGEMDFFGNNLRFEDFGVDVGSAVCTAINGGTAMNGLMIRDEATRTTLYNCVVKNVSALAKSPTDAVHCFLFEGLQDSYFENIHARYAQWGVAMKTISSTINGVMAYGCGVAGYTFKSDTGATGSPAIKSTARNIFVFADDAVAATHGILLQASTNDLYDFSLDGFVIDGYNVTTPASYGLRLTCDTRAVYVNQLSDVNISNGIIRGCNTVGLETYGAVNNVSINNVVVRDTVSNTNIKVWSDAFGVYLGNVIASSLVASSSNIVLQGRFSFDNISSVVTDDATLPSGIDLTPDSNATFKVGSYFGTLGFYGSSTWTPAFTGLTVVNGTGGATYTGKFEIVGKLCKFQVKIAVTGTATTESTAASTYINNLPFEATKEDVLLAVSGTVTNGGVGLVQMGTTSGYTPTWTAYNGTVIISGQYYFQD